MYTLVVHGQHKQQPRSMHLCYANASSNTVQYELAWQQEMHHHSAGHLIWHKNEVRVQVTYIFVHGRVPGKCSATHIVGSCSNTLGHQHVSSALQGMQAFTQQAYSSTCAVVTFACATQKLHVG